MSGIACSGVTTTPIAATAGGASCAVPPTTNQECASAPTTGNPILDASREDGYFDGTLSLQGVRAYDPNLNQWTTPDAYSGDVRDPMSQHPYMWNDNNPVQYSDPSGYEGWAPGTMGNIAPTDSKPCGCGGYVKVEANYGPVHIEVHATTSGVSGSFSTTKSLGGGKNSSGKLGGSIAISGGIAVPSAGHTVGETLSADRTGGSVTVPVADGVGVGGEGYHTSAGSFGGILVSWPGTTASGSGSFNLQSAASGSSQSSSKASGGPQ
jgi:RHS repeat-associated protein